jgi:hypothetical protein
MSDIVFYFRSRLFARRPGETHEDAIERYWETVDRRFEEWRDNQILEKANPKDEKDPKH